MLKLRFSKPLHKQYMDGKVSVCKYDCVILNNQTKEVIAEFTVTGTAKCSPNDTVNPELGIKLADSRAKLLAYKRAVGKYPDALCEELSALANKAIDILEFQQTLHYLKRKEVEHIKDICRETE